MNKLTTFNHAFWKSISSFKYYHDVVKAKFSFSLKFYIMFSVILGATLASSLSLLLYQPATEFKDRFLTRASYLYPEDMVITIKDGKLSTNVPEPLRIPFPYELITDVPPQISDQQQLYLLTIDTQNVLKNEDKQSIMYATENKLVLSEDDIVTDPQEYYFSDFDDTIIDKNSVSEWLNDIQPFIKNLPVLIVLGVFTVMVVIMPLIRLISLLILTISVFLFAQVMQVKLSFKKTFQLGLHAIVLPTLIQIFMTGMGIAPPFPFFNSILFLLYTLVILAELRKTENPVTKK